MTHFFDESVRAGVLGHMNGDHPEDNLLIVRAFAGDAGIGNAGITAGTGNAAGNAARIDDGTGNAGITAGTGNAAGITAARMTGFDGDGGRWEATLADGTTAEVAVPWPGGAISERREVRREIVALYDEACARLGVEPRPHA